MLQSRGAFSPPLNPHIYRGEKFIKNTSLHHQVGNPHSGDKNKQIKGRKVKEILPQSINPKNKKRTKKPTIG
jgi:hypothetical protein